jgi:hypothetical protein
MRFPLAVLIAISVVALASCGGESDAERAQNDVCDARSEIQKEIQALGSTDVETATVDGIRQRLDAINVQIGKIRDARGDLSDDRRQEVESAISAFGSQVKAAVDNLGKGGSLEQALTDFQNSLVGLRDSFQKSLAPIDC